jgi:hypothetical protein
MVEEKLVFLSEEGIQEEGFSNLRKIRMFYKDHTFSSSLRFEGFDVDEEINNTMNGIPQDEFDGYMCNIFDDSNSDGTMRKCSFDSMNEGWNEEGNGKKKKERTENENKGKNSCISLKGRCVWQGVDVSLWMMLDCLLQVVM